jgi:hypothetical protein
MAKGLGVSPKSVWRGLSAAEDVGLLRVERKAGRKVLVADVTVLAMQHAGGGRSPLRGPVPWSWLHPALRLSPGAVRVAMACWLQGGWERSGEVELALGEWAELGLSRSAAGRGVAELGSAGLVGVVRREGRSPVITVLAPRRATA